MLPDRISNPRHVVLESDATPMRYAAHNRILISFYDFVSLVNCSFMRSKNKYK